MLAMGIDNLLAEHKLRTTLTMLGMMFGVGAVIAMLSIGAGAEKEALALIDRLGTRNVVVRARSTDRELEEIRKKSRPVAARRRGDQGGGAGRDLAAPRIEVEPYQVRRSRRAKVARSTASADHREVTSFASPRAVSSTTTSRATRRSA